MLTRCYNIEDLRVQAKRRLPKGLFEFIDRATEDDEAMRRNRRSFKEYSLAPKVLVDVSRRSTETMLFGRKMQMPAAISPAGPAGFFWYEGELALARAAAASGIPYTLTTYSTVPMREIVASGAEIWLQLYLWNDRDISWQIVQQAKELGIQTLLLTVDTPVLGQREYLHKNGFLPPFKASGKAMFDMALHPRWLASVPLRYLFEGRWPSISNVPQATSRAERKQIEQRTGLAQTATWQDLEHLREIWPGQLLLKGILRPDDAERAIAAGCDGVVVSNHGGRNLDSANSPLEALPPIVQAIGGRAKILMDSGIRRGSDIVKALALGADAVLLGRSVLYGVAAGGQAGAERAIELLRSELDRSMALAGTPTISDIGPEILAPRHSL